MDDYINNKYIKGADYELVDVANGWDQRTKHIMKAKSFLLIFYFLFLSFKSLNFYKKKYY